MHTTTARRSGITLIEVTTILAVLAILAAALTPTVSNVIGKSKLQRARLDVHAIKKATLNLLEDVNTRGIIQDGSCPRGHQVPVDLLVSDGDIPSLGANASSSWTRPVDFKEVDYMEYHLTTNNPGGHSGHNYENWGGAYLPGPIGPDPWGNRYMINSRYLAPGHRYDVVVISAGPDEEIDSQFTLDGFVPGDDDIVSMISSGTVTSVGSGDGKTN